MPAAAREISGSFTISSAQRLADLLKTGALPIKLQLISSSQVSATLGKQALHQGLLAGIAGFIIVALFLLAFYRVLGLIAVGALVVYAIFFYALIKLVPITLTLPGIAGLILTIGVAADANIVIFERVKEELRGGRSIPAAIATGYKRGLSAIVDANVVTFMVAFILFLLATAGVKGFAFTLGVGTLVSFFTAVLLTQAVLGMMGRSKLIHSPAALGARPKPPRRFDFMGASKWFFSMSGVILLIGALSIGGKGLNFGIDFESGTRIKVELNRTADENGVRNAISPDGFGDAEIQRLSGSGAGKNSFQISTTTLSENQRNQISRTCEQKFGVKSYDFDFIGPTFGQTVAKSAVDRDHRLAAGDLDLHLAAIRVEIRGTSAHRVDARPAHHQRRVLASRPGGDDVDGRGAAHHLGLLALRHDHRVRPCARERPAHAARRLLADRQPLDERGADPLAGHVVLHGAADRRAALLRR